MSLSPTRVTIQIPNGSCTEIPVRRGTKISEIMGHEVFNVSAGYRTRLVSETGKIREPEMKVWKTQVGFPQKYCLVSKEGWNETATLLFSLGLSLDLRPLTLWDSLIFLLWVPKG